MFRLLCVTICRWLVRRLPCSGLSEESGAAWAERLPVAVLFLIERGPCSLRVGVLPARRW